MKKLLSVVAILILAGCILPAQSIAGYRGGWDPITDFGGPVNGEETPAFRPGINRVSGAIGTAEMFFTFTSRSLVAGSESVREMYLCDNQYRSMAFFGPDAVQPLLVDPAAQISYTDPAWSPDGHYLAYVQTDQIASYAEIWVQEFTLSADIYEAVVPIGSPTLVAGGGPGALNRHPAWSPDGTSLVYESNAANSFDLYTIQVFPSLGSAARITFNDAKGEIMPAWSPDGSRIAYSSNEFGPFAIKILDLASVPNPTDGYLADVNLAPVTHANAAWSYVPGENVLYYDANQNEDPNNPGGLWRLDLDTQQKCQMNIDSRSSADIDVSRITNQTVDGIKFNYFLFATLAGGSAQPYLWRGEWAQICIDPLPIGVSLNPPLWNLTVEPTSDEVTLRLFATAEMTAAGYQSQSFNGPLEGLKMRASWLLSPTIMGQSFPDANGDAVPEFADSTGYLEFKLSRRDLQDRFTALGLIDRWVPMEIHAYSNNKGRQFKTYAYLKLTRSSLPVSAVELVANSPNPFNPHTKITFMVLKPGNVDVRVFDVRGRLVKTLAKGWFPQGQQTVTWDGRTNAGAGAASGMYFAVAKSNGDTSKLKMMLMK